MMRKRISDYIETRANFRDKEAFIEIYNDIRGYIPQLSPIGEDISYDFSSRLLDSIDGNLDPKIIINSDM